MDVPGGRHEEHTDSCSVAYGFTSDTTVSDSESHSDSREDIAPWTRAQPSSEPIRSSESLSSSTAAERDEHAGYLTAVERSAEHSAEDQRSLSAASSVWSATSPSASTSDTDSAQSSPRSSSAAPEVASHGTSPAPSLPHMMVSSVAMKAAEMVAKMGVPSTGSPVAVDRNQSPVERAMERLVNLQRAYVARCDALVQRYLYPMREAELLSPSVLRRLFGNAEGLQQQAHSVLEAIQSVRSRVHIACVRACAHTALACRWPLACAGRKCARTRIRSVERRRWRSPKPQRSRTLPTISSLSRRPFASSA